MGEYVEITGSVFDLIRAGQHISDLGTNLDTSMTQHVARIEQLEGAETWGSDRIGYHWAHNKEGGYLQGKGDADPLPTSLKKLLRPSATSDHRDAPPSVGAVAKQLGDTVVEAMSAYHGTDADSGSDIGSVEV